MTLIPQRAPRLRDQVYDALRGMIRDGTYPQDSAAEEALAALLNVSRTPVREALFQLCREGVLEDTGRGYRRPELTGRDVREIVELRRLLEPAMARAVTERATAPDRAAFEAIVTREEQALDPDDAAAFVGANSDFRRLFFASCGNGRIAQTMLIFDDQIAHLRELTLGPVANRIATLEPHRRFLAALAAHDANDGYIRRLLVIGATSVIRVARKETSSKLWATKLLERKPARVVSVALANKTARIVWAMLKRGEDYAVRVPATAT